MRTTASLVKLSIFAAVTTFLTAILASTIGNLSFGDHRTYKIRFSDATGLLGGDEVRIAGVIVGKVTGIEVADRREAEVTVELTEDVPVTTTTGARVRYRNLVGLRYLALTQGAQPGTPLPEGATIPISNTAPALDLTVLFNGFKPLFRGLSPEDTNRLATEIIRTFQGEGGTIDTLLARTASLTNTVADRDAAIGRVLANLTEVLATIDDRDERFGRLISELQRLVSGLAQDRQTLADSLVGVNDLAESTAGLLEDIRPPLDDDIERLGATAKNLADGRAEIERVLNTLPDRLNEIIGTGSYASWFNFYLCEFTGTVTVADRGRQPLPRFRNTAPMCQS